VKKDGKVKKDGYKKATLSGDNYEASFDNTTEGVYYVSVKDTGNSTTGKSTEEKKLTQDNSEFKIDSDI
jgi:hypothetical protein